MASERFHNEARGLRGFVARGLDNISQRQREHSEDLIRILQETVVGEGWLNDRFRGKIVREICRADGIEMIAGRLGDWVRGDSSRNLSREI